VLPVLASIERITLGADRGLEHVYPANVDVQGLRVSEAITKICRAAGFSWWLNPGDDGSVMEFFRTGSPGPDSRAFYLGALAGAKHGTYSDPDELSEPLSFPIVDGTGDAEGWNIDDIDINYDFRDFVGTIIGVTSPIKIQNFFPLRKGWSKEIFLKFVDPLIKSSVAQAAESQDSEAREFTLLITPTKGAKAGQSFRYELMQKTGSQESSLGTTSASAQSEKGKLTGFDSPWALFRRWITDETGRVLDMKGESRAPYRFNKRGLIPIRGSGYMVKPRPFLSQNIVASRDGDRQPPRSYFAKFFPGATSRKKGDALHFKEARIDFFRSPTLDSKVGGDYYPYGVKKGNIRTLKGVSGIMIDGGNLNLMNITIDPAKNKIFVFNPLVWGAVTHDQAFVTDISFILKIGVAATGRRLLDGKRFRCDFVLAVDPYAVADNEQREDDATGPIWDDYEGDVIKDYSVNELDKLTEEMLLETDVYGSPKSTIRASIPTITDAYELGVKVTGISKRFEFGAGGGTNSVVGVSFDLKGMNTTVNVESERSDPHLNLVV